MANMLTRKVLEYQRRKLAEAEQRLGTHLEIRRKLGMEASPNPRFVREQDRMIRIWQDNIKRLRSEIRKVERK